MERICKRAGMYRWSPEAWMLQTWTKPSLEQITTLRWLFRLRNPILDMRRGRRRAYYEYQNWEREEALGDLRNFYGDAG